ncbi:MAG TPA: hypothetical protein VLM38_12490 [Blastocatellia bacterium]|nr:hypothetical protein [Blastocatellia bacterium]
MESIEKTPVCVVERGQVGDARLKLRIQTDRIIAKPFKPGNSIVIGG